eukprot:44433-Eustigmatos_ZCMA.PRE.1
MTPVQYSVMTYVRRGRGTDRAVSALWCAFRAVDPLAQGHSAVYEATLSTRRTHMHVYVRRYLRDTQREAMKYIGHS